MPGILTFVLAAALSPAAPAASPDHVSGAVVASPSSAVPGADPGAVPGASSAPRAEARTSEPRVIEPREVSAYLARHPGALVLDVRRPDEFVASHIPDASLVPLDTLASWAAGQPRDRPLVLVCRAGRRSATAAGQLAEAGFTDLAQIRGGLLAWESAGLATCSGAVQAVPVVAPGH